jgi:hypothetical protein
MASLTWAILVVTATGGTDSYPSLSYLENAFISVFNCNTLRLPAAFTRFAPPPPWVTAPPVFARAVLAALFWTTVLATFCDLISKTNPEIAEFHQSSTADGQHTQTWVECRTHDRVCAVAELEVFMGNYSLPDEMRCRLREHLHHRKHVRVAQRAVGVTQQMSADLQIEVIFICYGRWLARIPFLCRCEKACIVQVCTWRPKHA